MDTGTHLVVGFGLAGLAYVDPLIAAHSTAATAVLIGTVIGSQAPDFDSLLRLKSNAAYIKNHRGITHSLPFLGIWTILITLFLNLAFPAAPLLHVAGWVFAAVALHVFSDLFNTYGTQALRPLTERWISWNIIHIFDPFIFISHIIGILMWSLHLASPAYIFTTVYALLVLYYVWRTLAHAKLQRSLPLKDKNHLPGERYTLIPTVHLNAWNVVKQKADGSFMLGECKNEQLSWIDSAVCDIHPAVEISKKHTVIASFLYFSSFACAEVKEHGWGFEVRWMDVRYRHRKQYPFVAVLLMDHKMEPLDSYVGWLSDSRLEKKLRVDLLS